MTRRREPLFVEQRLVVAFDICSSSNIIEDLTLTGNLSRLRNLLIRTKNFLQRESERLKFELYKFTGDGWILLFPSRTSGPRLMRFLTDLSGRFSQNFRAQILPMLEQKPKIVGLTFGVDRGDLSEIGDGKEGGIHRPSPEYCMQATECNKGQG